MSASRKRSSHQQESDMAMVQTHVFTTKPSSLVWIASLIALMNAWSVGLVIGFFSAGMQSLMDANPQIGWDKEGHMSSWVGGSMALGGLVGSLVAGPVLSKLGPRNSTIAANVPFFIGWIMLMFGKSLFVLIVARLLGGFALGFSSGAVPVYCIEISTPNIRGILGACFQLFVNVGILSASFFGYWLEYKPLISVSAVICVIGPILMLFMPESPSYLLGKHGQMGKAQIINTLRRLRSADSNPEEECDELIKNTQPGGQSLILGWSEIKRPQIYKAIFCSLGLMLFQQMSGVNAVIFYQLKIFSDAGSTLDPKVAAIITGLVLVLSCLVGSACVDKLGRKTFLFWTGLGLFIAQITLAVYFLGQPDPISANSTTSLDAVTTTMMPDVDDPVKAYGQKYGVIALIAVFAYLGLFSLALGPIPWLMVPEMTPYHARTFVTALATSFNWFLVFIVTKNFEAITNGIGAAGAFFFFASFPGMSLFFIWFLLPETKGKTQEQLEKLFD